MVDIQSATAEIKRGTKRRRNKKKPNDKNIMFASVTQGGHNDGRNRDQLVEGSQLRPYSITLSSSRARLRNGIWPLVQFM